MSRLVLAGFILVGALAGAAGATTTPVRPIPQYSLLEIDRKIPDRNYLPTRMFPGYVYDRWTFRGGVMRIDFRGRTGLVVEWRVESMTGACDAGKQASYQVIGNKVWWAQQGSEQFAWRCVFDQRGKPVRVGAATTAPTTKIAAAGLGILAASGKRY